MIHLEGDLGAGKTTFARALLTSLGVGERVKSPTYSLVESYRVGDLDAHHLDLYRIADAGELEWLGLGDLWARFGARAHRMARARHAARCRAADLMLHLKHAGERREVAAEALSARGQRFLAALRGDAKTVG